MRLIKSVIISALFLFVGAQTVLAAAKTEFISKNTAEEIASKYVPGQSELLKSELENDRYVFRFYNKNSQEWYKITIEKTKGEIRSFDSCKTLTKGGSQVLLEEEEIRGIVRDEVGENSQLTCSLNSREDLYQYEVSVKGDGFAGKYVIHPESGAILERKITVGKQEEVESLLEDENFDVPLASSVYIGSEKARKAALNKVPGAEVAFCDLEYENGRAIYKGQLKKGCFRYEFSIDAITGTMITWDMQSE